MAAKGPEHIGAVVQKTPEPGYIVGIPAEDERAGVSLNVADYDRYSVTLQHLEAQDNSLTINEDDTESYLRQCATEITKRLVYLDEPLTLLELNIVDGVAQLRSAPPKNTPDESTYWEIFVQATPHPRAKLTRHHWTAATPAQRSLVTYPATFATLGRLAEDLAASLTVLCR